MYNYANMKNKILIPPPSYRADLSQLVCSHDNKKIVSLNNLFSQNYCCKRTSFLLLNFYSKPDKFLQSEQIQYISFTFRFKIQVKERPFFCLLNL